jgi:putative DNA primase/helicase
MAALRLWCGGDDEMMAYLQRFAGYCLTGEVREQSVFLLFGEGGTGKSTFIDPLVAMMGDYADYTAPTLLLQEKGSKHPTEVADLFRLRLAVAQELNEGQRWDMQRFKALSGNKRAKARRMNEDFWSFDLTHKFVIAANDRPEVSSEDGAFWRRIHTIPFRLRIPEEGRDRGMLGRFVEEWPGILAWAVQGAMDYYREGLSPCGAVEEANACYRGETDTLGSYLAEGCLTGATARVQAQHFREGYVRHCHERGLTPMGPGRLSRAVRLRACFLGQERTVDGIFYLGIGLLPVADAAS